ncbi:MFS transporter [Streptosporangium canum]|uniref:MFS transporter n=1 Tax=Streptosporangium canum TaxID=324952 RepID=UPI0036740709
MADTIAATLALPILGTSTLGGQLTTRDLQWVMSAAAVPYAALLAAAGRLADAIGRQRMLLIGAMLFTAGAMTALAAPSLTVLLGARMLQGAAAAAMIPASLALLLAEISPARRAAAIGSWSAAAGLGGVMLHGGGGWLAEQFGWRSLFAPSAILGALLVVAVMALPPSTTPRGRLPDLIGSALLLAGIGASVLALSKGQVWGWRSLPTLGLAGGGGALVVAALWRSGRHPVPAVDITLWRRPSFLLAGVIALLYGLISFSVLAIAPLFLREQWGLSLAAVGLAMAPISVGVLLASLTSGRLTRRYGARPVIYAGVVVVVAASLWLIAGAMHHQPRLPIWIPASALLGLGLGAISTGASAAAALSAGAARYASAVGASMTARQVGGAVGVAAAMVLLERPILDGPMPGYSSVLAVVIMLAVAAGLLALFIWPASPDTVAPAAARVAGHTVSADRSLLPSMSGPLAPVVPWPLLSVPLHGGQQGRVTIQQMYAAAARFVAAADYLLAQPEREADDPRNDVRSRRRPMLPHADSIRL